MVTIRQDRKEHSLPVIYSFFSNRYQISPSSSKVYDKLITMPTGKKVGVPVLVGELYIAISQETELNIKANPPCFQYARARGRAIFHKLCAERMRSANARNDLKMSN